ncbi:NAD-dependent epimerase/dehydratase family protein [Pseudonocardia sp. WMMC193]|uniref:NAD-dependent epimerase/dehydratase family protein n=1 Tax=Pseudonocardia sp. WMMC193 TaxID=2911965 RepID=UPI001F027DA6|nr:NAD-dependent epimerase/dehydratase family protein [Pseudonocardia sp. WMMC193]MCF7551461.1 NAD-dependent epimerase/dehydratase family protein [Pseudonocardia sp. WMMC193]
MLLLTGGTGYLGSALVAQAQGRDLRVLVRDPAKAAAVLPAGVEAVVGRLDDPGSLDAALAGCSAVVHLAGLVGGTEAQIRAANVDGTRALLAAMGRAGIRRLVHCSSGAAVMDPTGLVSETPTGPQALTDPYSRAKAEADELVLAADVEASFLLPGSIYGPSPAGPHSYNGLLLAAARGELDAVVDAPIGWTLAADTARAALRVLDAGAAGTRYVLYGEVAPFGQVVNRACALLGSPHRVRTLPPGSDLGPDAPTFARRSEVYGRFPTVHVEDANTRGLGIELRGVADGLRLTCDWLTP